jgi:hypothetical protein
VTIAVFFQENYKKERQFLKYKTKQQQQQQQQNKKSNETCFISALAEQQRINNHMKNCVEN